MKKLHILCGLSCILLFTAGLTGCRKENGIDNNTVVKRPYSLYFSDTQGSLYNTSAGENESFNLIFPPDGYNPRSLLITGPNILWAKHNLHLSENEGAHFNPVDSTLNPGAQWQSIMVRVPDHGRTYLCSGPYFGVKFSDDHGKTWWVDTAMDISADPALTRLTSLAVLGNGNLFGYDHVSRKLFRKDGKDNQWKDVFSGNIPSNGLFYLSTFNNILLLTDYTGAEGVWHSEDEGVNWTKYDGLPAVRLLATAAPFNKKLFVGTDSMGVYQLSGNVFKQMNSGMEPNPSVRGIVAKENIYKNNISRQYIYISTNYGIYRSEDGGETWALVFPGNFTIIY